MTTTTSQFRTARAATAEPGLYYVIGHMKNMEPIARNRHDENLYKPLCEVALSALLSIGPDGLIIQRGLDVFITNGGRLEPFDPARDDWTNTVQATPAPELTAQEWRELIIQVCKEAEWWMAHYIRGRV